MSGCYCFYGKVGCPSSVRGTLSLRARSFLISARPCAHCFSRASTRSLSKEQIPRRRRRRSVLSAVIPDLLRDGPLLCV